MSALTFSAIAAEKVGWKPKAKVVASSLGVCMTAARTVLDTELSVPELKTDAAGSSSSSSSSV